MPYMPLPPDLQPAVIKDRSDIDSPERWNPPKELLDQPLGVETLDAIREDVRQKLTACKDIEPEAKLMHGLRSFSACREIGDFLCEHPDLLEGNRNPRFAYPGSGRDFSFLGIAEQLLQRNDIDSVYFRCIERNASRDEHELPDAKRLNETHELLELYAQARGNGFVLEKKGENTYVLTVNGKPITIEIVFHEISCEDEELTEGEELNGIDALFFHDLGGNYTVPSRLKPILRTIQAAYCVRGKAPLVIVDDAINKFWEYFGDVLLRTQNAYGHRGPRSLSAGYKSPACEFGKAFQRGAVLRPDANTMALSEMALNRLAAIACYIESPSAERRQADLSRSGGFIEAELEGLLEIVRLEHLSPEQLREITLAFIKCLDVWSSDSDMQDMQSLNPIADMPRTELLKAFAGQARDLLIDHVAVNTMMHHADNYLNGVFESLARADNYAVRLIKIIRMAVKAVLATADDEAFYLFLATLIHGGRTAIGPTEKTMESLFFRPDMIKTAQEIQKTLEQRGGNLPFSFTEEAKGAMMKGYMTKKRDRLARDLDLYKKEGPRLMWRMRNIKQQRADLKRAQKEKKRGA